MAREKVKADGYQYKKGYSRSAPSSSDSGIDEHVGKRNLEKSVKRKHTDAEERKKAITNIKALLKQKYNYESQLAALERKEAKFIGTRRNLKENQSRIQVDVSLVNHSV